MANVKKNYIYETIYQILIMVVPFVVSPYVSRVLHAEGLGIYSYTNAILTYFTILTILGIRNYGGRMIARCSEKKERSKLFWSIFTAHLILSVVSIVAYIVYLFFFSQYFYVSLVQGINIIASVIDISWFFTGMENFKILTLRNGIIKIITCVSVFLLVKSQNDVIIYVAILSTGTLLSSLSLIPCAWKHICLIKPDWKEVASHFKPLFVLAIPQFLVTVYMTTDKVLLGKLANKQQVAFYENAEKMVIIRNFIYSLGTVMLPRISSLYAQKSFDKIKEYIKQSTELSLIMAYAFSFGLMACSNEFAPWFWGEEFRICGRLIHYVAVMILFNTIANTIRSLYLIPLNRDKEFVTVSAIGAVSNVALDVLLIPFFQAEGAWIATLLSSVLVCFYQMWIVRKEVPMLKYCISTWYYFVLGLCMLFLCRGIGGVFQNDIKRLIAEILIGIVFYSLGCLLYWKKNNKEFYLNLLRLKKHNL